MTDSSESPLVLVTGASGFLGAHCVVQLLEQGYRVRGTLRNMALEPDLRAALSKWTDFGDRLEFVRTDLLADAGWKEAVEGCEYVLHVAAPYPLVMPKDENDLIVPMRAGTLRVLEAAAVAGVRRVVLTSSVAAVGYGHSDYTMTLDESVWSNLTGEVSAYTKGKTLAEQAAWEFFANPSRSQVMELCVINPGYIMGPSIDGRRFSTSGDIVRDMLLGKYPGAARLQFWITDVRDIAAVHVAAMTSPLTPGRRYLALAEPLWMKEVAEVLNTHLADRGYKVPTRSIPDFAYRLSALFDPGLKSGVPILGVNFRFASDRLHNDLDWKPRGAADAVRDTAHSLIAFGLV